MLLPGEMVEADRGYRDCKCRHTEVVVSPSDERAKAAVMARHEGTNGDLKIFGALSQAWRHALEKHSIAFRSCVTLTQLKYNVCGNKNQVHY